MKQDAARARRQECGMKRSSDLGKKMNVEARDSETKLRVRRSGGRSGREEREPRLRGHEAGTWK